MLFFFISNKLQKVSFRVKKEIKFHQEKITKTNITNVGGRRSKVVKQAAKVISEELKSIK